ncbi:hypothetical protein SAMN05443545_11027 [Aidingimonas halophila]|uniref:Uncharacterized protein n=1 Tax=Aidingimonas halophila TaxID=574349 RepID=A0A1H3GTF5_9GAMM|nr:hypothetical protein SAMN05443545_11027 [Aidingimonas halophila]
MRCSRHLNRCLEKGLNAGRPAYLCQHWPGIRQRLIREASLYPDYANIET